MNKLQVVSLFLAIPAAWFSWIGFIYLASTDHPFVSDLVIFVIGAFMAFIFVVITVQEFQRMGKPNK